MFVTERFNLNKSGRDRIRAINPAFGFNGFGEATYYRTYSRTMKDGSQEHWSDTIIRAVEGTMSIRKDHHVKNHLAWDEEERQEYAAGMGEYMAKMYFLPPGRGLWAMGTDHVYKKGSAALNNCGAADTSDLILAADWTMDMLMNGVGVGFNTPMPKKAWDGVAYIPDTKEPQFKFVIPDSREGWVMSVNYLLGCYIPAKSKTSFTPEVMKELEKRHSNNENASKNNLYPWVEFDYSQIRPMGAKIGGFGGIASGPDPLKKLHSRIIEYMDKYTEWYTRIRYSEISDLKKIEEDRRNGLEYNSVRCVADIMNSIGACVVAGNVRRSAEIALGDVQSDTFLNLKNYEKNPDRAEIGWMSNNSVVLQSKEDFMKIPEIAERIRDNGEPGIFNLVNIQKFGRFTKEMHDDAFLSNPCAEIPLEPFELCNLAEVFPTKCPNDEVLHQAMRYATFYASTVALLPTHRPETNAVVARNRRIGVSLSGVADWLDQIGATRLNEKLSQGYHIVRDENTRLAKEAGVPASIRVTTVKPSGTISQLAGVSSGMHFPTFSYSIRRMRVSENSPIADVLKNSGIPWEKDTYSDNTLVFEFSIDQGSTRKATDVSAWEQFSLLTTLQRHWADNMVSCTIYFNKETEGHQIEQMLGQNIPLIKSVSMLPHTEEGAYAQMPYEGITKEEYEKRLKDVKPIDWSSFRESDGQDTKFCTNETCEFIPKEKVKN